MCPLPWEGGRVGDTQSGNPALADPPLSWHVLQEASIMASLRNHPNIVR